MESNFNAELGKFAATLKQAHGSKAEYGEAVLGFASSVASQIAKEGRTTDTLMKDFREHVYPFRKRLNVDRDPTVFEECEYFTNFRLWDVYCDAVEEERTVIMDHVRALVSAMSITEVYQSIPGCNNITETVARSSALNNGNIDVAALMSTVLNGDNVATMLSNVAGDTEKARSMVDTISTMMGQDMSPLVTDEDLLEMQEQLGDPESLKESMDGMQDMVQELLGNMGPINVRDMMQNNGGAVNLADMMGNTEMQEKLKEMMQAKEEASKKDE